MKTYKCSCGTIKSHQDDCNIVSETWWAIVLNGLFLPAGFIAMIVIVGLLADRLGA